MEYDMPPTTFVAIILAFWSSFHLAHTFCMNNAYFGHRIAAILVESNITITFFHVRWFTSRWNRLFIWIGRMWNSKLKIWFDAGALCGVITMLVGTVLLFYTLCSTITQVFFKPAVSVLDKQVLSIIVPGVNLPIEDIWYLMSAIFVSGIFHEFGHAIAAAREGIQINGFGMFAFLIYPGAFVDLNSEDMNRKDPLCQLRVYCAGVWHNFILCLLACGVILVLPWLLLPLYTTHGAGVLVIHQTQNSPLVGDMGLHTGDHVTEIDSCHVSNIKEWYYCINKTRKSPQWGSCVSLSRIKELSSHTTFSTEARLPQDVHSSKQIWVDCCNMDAPATHLCYQYLPLYGKNEMFSCLPGRVIITSPHDCLTNEDCKDSLVDEGPIVCAKAYTEPGAKFIRLVASRDREKHNVLFIGDPTDIVRSVTVSDLFPRFRALPMRLPSILLRFLQYIFSMSGALALLNIVPCYALDGQWAFKAMLDYCDTGGYLTQNGKELLCKVVLFSGTSLLAANILFGFVHLFTR